MHSLVLLLPFRHSLSCLALQSLAMFCPVVVLGCWSICTARSALWEFLASTNLEAWLAAWERWQGRVFRLLRDAIPLPVLPHHGYWV